LLAEEPRVMVDGPSSMGSYVVRVPLLHVGVDQRLD
jgi:hypothetical protein